MPGLEFDGVFVTLEDTRLDHVITTQDYFGGVEVARFDGLRNELVQVEVSLTQDGEVVVSRLVRVEIDGTTGVTVLVTRDCRSVTCDDAVATTCLGGQCVDPRCVEETPELCRDDACSDASDCPTPAACARAVCERVACTVETIPDACPRGQVCDPERGCVDPACGSCDDSNFCTADSCIDGMCVYDVRDGSECGPGRCEMNRCVVRTDAWETLSLPGRASGVAIADDVAAVGMLDIDTVQIFFKEGRNWAPGPALSPGDDGFGCRIGLQGDLLAIVACGTPYNLVIFRRNGERYSFEARIPFADIVPAVDETLASLRPVAVHDGVVVLGVNQVVGGGGVAVFERGGGGWIQSELLNIESEPTFGSSLAINDRLIVGAPGLTATGRGTLFVYERVDGTFQMIHRTTADATQLGARVWAFGPQRLRALGETPTGTALFKLDEREMDWEISLIERFPSGGIVDIADSMLVVGRPDASVGDIANAGIVELTYFNIQVQLQEAFPATNRRFGEVVATDGTNVVVAPVPPDFADAPTVTFLDANDLESTLVPPE